MVEFAEDSVGKGSVLVSGETGLLLPASAASDDSVRLPGAAGESNSGGGDSPSSIGGGDRTSLGRRMLGLRSAAWSSTSK